MALTKQQSSPQLLQWVATEARVARSTSNAGSNSKSSEEIHIPACQIAIGNNKQADEGELHKKVQHPKAGTFNYNYLSDLVKISGLHRICGLDTTIQIGRLLNGTRRALTMFLDHQQSVAT